MVSRTGMALVATLAVALGHGAARAAEAGRSAETGAARDVAGVPPGEVDGATARKLVSAGIKVVDVRTPAEFASGHVPGAVNIPFDQVGARHGEIGSPSTPVLLYCKTGRRTDVAARTLREKGFTAIYDLQAYDRWVASGPR